MLASEIVCALANVEWYVCQSFPESAPDEYEVIEEEEEEEAIP